MSTFSDNELIQKAKNGDKQAYKELFKKHKRKILGYIYWYVGDYQKAEEITIDTFLDVYKRLPDYEEKGKFLPWVYTIARNFARKEFRKRKNIKEISLNTPASGNQKASIGDVLGDNKLRPDYRVMKDEFRKILEDIMSNLDEKYRNVLLLCEVHELSYEEVANIVKSNKITVGTRLHKARKLLYQELKKRGYTVRGKRHE